MSPAADAPTPSTLMYLFADRVAPKDKALTEGIEVPCRDMKVQKRPLTGAMFAAAFLSLRDRGVIAFEVQQKKVLFVKTKKVVVTKSGEDEGRGLEAAVLAGLGGAGPQTVSEVIRKWFGHDVFAPWDDVIAVAVEEGHDLGCFEEKAIERGRLGQRLLSPHALRPSCERIEQFAEAFEAFHARWQEFQSQESELYAELVEECAGAIKSREEAADHDFD